MNHNAQLLNGVIHNFQIRYVEYDKVDDEGGHDEHNDCFYNCLYTIIPVQMQKAFPDPASLKKYLGISRDALVHYDHISLIENKLKNCSIDVTGFTCYSSTVENAKHTITLELENKHYIIPENTKDEKYSNYTKGICEKARPLCIYQYDPENPSNVFFYDGTSDRKSVV